MHSGLKLLFTGQFRLNGLTRRVRGQSPEQAGIISIIMTAFVKKKRILPSSLSKFAMLRLYKI